MEHIGAFLLENWHRDIKKNVPAHISRRINKGIRDLENQYETVKIANNLAKNSGAALDAKARRKNLKAKVAKQGKMARHVQHVPCGRKNK